MNTSSPQDGEGADKNDELEGDENKTCNNNNAKVKFYVRTKRKYSGKKEGLMPFKKGCILAVVDEKNASTTTTSDSEELLYFGYNVDIDEVGEGNVKNDKITEGWFPAGRVAKIKEDEVDKLRQIGKIVESPSSKPARTKNRSPRFDEAALVKGGNDDEASIERTFSDPPSSGDEAVTPRGSKRGWKRLSGQWIASRKLKSLSSDNVNKNVDQGNKAGNQTSSSLDSVLSSSPSDSSPINIPRSTETEVKKKSSFGSLRRKGQMILDIPLSPRGGEDKDKDKEKEKEKEKETEKDKKKQRRKSWGVLSRSTPLSSSPTSSFKGSQSVGSREVVRKKTSIVRKGNEKIERTSDGDSLDLINEGSKEREKSVKKKKTKKKRTTFFDPEDSGPRSAPNLQFRVDQYKREHLTVQTVKEEEERQRGGSEIVYNSSEGKEQEKEKENDREVGIEETGKGNEREREKEEEEKARAEREMRERLEELERQHELLKQKAMAKALEKARLIREPATGAFSTPNLQQTIAAARRIKQDQELRQHHRSSSAGKKGRESQELEGEKEREKEELEKEKEKEPEREAANGTHLAPVMKRDRSRSRSLGAPRPQQLVVKKKETRDDIDVFQQILEDISGWEEENIIAERSVEKDTEVNGEELETDPISPDDNFVPVNFGVGRRSSRSQYPEDFAVDQDPFGRRLAGIISPILGAEAKKEVYPPPSRSKSGPLIRPKQMVTMPPKAFSATAMTPVDFKAVKLRKTVVGAGKPPHSADMELEKLKKKAEDEAIRRNEKLEQISEKKMKAAGAEVNVQLQPNLINNKTNN